MDKPYIIIICGIPASGKTTYGIHIAERLRIPFLSKDDMKQCLHDAFGYDTTVYANAKIYGMAAYVVSYHTAEMLMRCGLPFVFESNFTPMSVDILEPLIEGYGYQALTIAFDADIRVLHKRFVARDDSGDRPEGLKSASGIYHDFDTFANATLPLRAFDVGGERITIDTTDFSNVHYDEIDRKVDAFIQKQKKQQS